MTRFSSLRQTVVSAFGALVFSGAIVAAAVLPAQTAVAATVFHF
jgi:hypothetical protein